MARQPLVRQGFLNVKASRSHSVKTHDTRRTPLDKLLDQNRDLYMTTHNTHKKLTSMPPGAFELTIPAIERPQTHALAGMGNNAIDSLYIHFRVMLLKGELKVTQQRCSNVVFIYRQILVRQNYNFW
jgi:hypothetical protein